MRYRLFRHDFINQIPGDVNYISGSAFRHRAIQCFRASNIQFDLLLYSGVWKRGLSSVNGELGFIFFHLLTSFLSLIIYENTAHSLHKAVFHVM